MYGVLSEMVHSRRDSWRDMSPSKRDIVVPALTAVLLTRSTSFSSIEQSMRWFDYCGSHGVKAAETETALSYNLVLLVDNITTCI